jgi:hypothetical protein
LSIPRWIAAKRGETGVAAAHRKLHEPRPPEHEAARAAVRDDGGNAPQPVGWGSRPDRLRNRRDHRDRHLRDSGEAIPIALIAALLPLSEIAELVNIGTLFAFLIVNLAVIWLRRTKPNMERGFRVPFVPVFPLIGAALCVYLMTKLPLESWIRFIVWLVLGHVVYAAYGYRHSLLRREP